MQRKNRVTVTLTDDNMKRMMKAVDEGGITRTKFINKACEDVVIICIKEGDRIAQEFMRLRIALENCELNSEDRKVGEQTCQSLNLLTQKIVAFRN